ncbi:MAG: alpha/beta hydrolase [Ilumatobacteraceae bacterium]
MTQPEPASSNGALIPGADAWSHDASHSATGPSGAPGALVLHGFTGNPGSMRGLAEAFAAAGFHVEMPRLPGHGTTVEDMLTTGWADWAGEAEAALQRLSARAERVVVAGLSMGGSLTLRLGADHPDLLGIICINPATQAQPDEVLVALDGMLADGTTVMPGIGSDIADPDAHESAYDGTPVAPLLSFMREGLAPLESRYADMRIPLLLMTSLDDHVVPPAQSDHLAEHYGGPVERVTLERSFHVATQDYDKALIFERSVEFARRVTSTATSR